MVDGVLDLNSKNIKYSKSSRIPRFKKKKTRRSLIKNKKTTSETFLIMGTNSNGLLSKKESLLNNILTFQPAVIHIQETKVTQKGQLQLEGYDIFESVRLDNNGGSLLTAIHQNLSPVFICEGDKNQEILVVGVKMGNFLCRFINAYGPREYCDNEIFFSFFNRLDH